MLGTKKDQAAKDEEDRVRHVEGVREQHEPRHGDE
jgi:hypothetical protein